MMEKSSVQEFFGRHTFNEEFLGLKLMESRFSAHEVLPWHEHGEGYLCIVLGGTYEEESHGSHVLARGGSMLLHPEGHRHRNRFGNHGGHCLSVVPSCDWLEQGPWRQWLKSPAALELGGRAPQIMRLRQELARNDDVSITAITATVLDMLVADTRNAGGRMAPSWLGRVVEALDANLGTRPDLAKLAVDAGVHPAHLCRTFRRWKGKSIGEYLRQRRLDAALSLLARTSGPLTAVAQDAGFSDHAHFCRVVRAATGLTPSAYRANFRKTVRSPAGT